MGLAPRAWWGWRVPAAPPGAKRGGTLLGAVLPLVMAKPHCPSSSTFATCSTTDLIGCWQRVSGSMRK